MKRNKNNKPNNTLDITFLLDRSGSMADSVENTIKSYNEYLKNQKNNENVRITTVLFDDEYEILHDRTPIKNVPKLTSKEYYVRGCTALLDAIGRTIKYLDKQDTNKVLFVITTDGYENASNKYTKEKIRELIKGHSKWEFIYIGANIDSFAEASSIGLKKKNIANYQKSAEGIDCLFKSISNASQMMCENENLDESWKKDLK